MDDASYTLVAGRTLASRYRLDAPIAQGGMAVVWRGDDEVLARPVAVKVLLDTLATDPAVRERFRREAIAAARLAHPNVVATYDTGIDDGHAFIVMELVQGPTLRDLLAERGPLPVPVALSVADQIADALGAAHRAGLVHRDIKPANVLVCEDEGPLVRVKVTDFGIAKAAEEAGGADLTITGTVIGTPKYLAPEQVQGHEPDPRADLYALGVVLFEMVTGRPPFEGATQMATALSHLTEVPPTVSSLRPGTPPELDDLVAALLAKDPAGRYATATDVRAALAAVPRTPVAAGDAGDAPTGPPPADATAAMRRPTGPATVVAPVPEPAPLAPAPASAPPVRGRRRRWLPAAVVGALLVAGAVIAAVLLSSSPSAPSHKAAATPPTTAAPSAYPVAAVRVVVAQGHDVPDATGVDNVLDGNPSTSWQTFQYANAHFGNYYPGIGLAFHLDASHPLHRLTVSFPNPGFSMSAYVASATPGFTTTDPSAAGWGAPVASTTATGTSASLPLGGKTGDWVLLWITSSVGPTNQVSIGDVTIN